MTVAALKIPYTGSYVFTPGAAGAGTLQFTGISGFNIDYLAFVGCINPSAVLYAPGAFGITAISGDTITLAIDTSTLTSASPLVIYYFDPAAVQSVSDAAAESSLASIDNKTPAYGTAGTPSANVLSVQGVTGGTPVPMSGVIVGGNGAQFNGTQTHGDLFAVSGSTVSIAMGSSANIGITSASSYEGRIFAAFQVNLVGGASVGSGSYVYFGFSNPSYDPTYGPAIGGGNVPNNMLGAVAITASPVRINTFANGTSQPIGLTGWDINGNSGAILLLYADINGGTWGFSLSNQSSSLYNFPNQQGGLGTMTGPFVPAFGLYGSGSGTLSVTMLSSAQLVNFAANSGNLIYIPPGYANVADSIMGVQDRDLAALTETLLGATAAATSRIPTVGTPGSPSSQVISMQGVVGGTAMPISGSVAATQSGTWNVELNAGSNIVGKFGIDQTTPGTTNGVQVNAALPAGSNVIGKIGIDQTTDGTTNAVHVNNFPATTTLGAGSAAIGTVGVTALPATPAGANIIGKIGIDQTTNGTTNAVYVNNWPATTSVTQSGTWTIQPGNTANTTPWLFTISQGGNAAAVTAGNALKVDGSAVTQPVSAASLPLPANAAKETGGNLATLAATITSAGSPAASGLTAQPTGALIAANSPLNVTTSTNTGTLLTITAANLGRFTVTVAGTFTSGTFQWLGVDENGSTRSISAAPPVAGPPITATTAGSVGIWTGPIPAGFSAIQLNLTNQLGSGAATVTLTADSQPCTTISPVVFFNNAAVGDAQSLPTSVGPVVSYQELYNGTNYDRGRNNTTGTITASGTITAGTSFSSDVTNYNGRGAKIFLNITATAGSGAITVSLQEKDPVSGNYVDVSGAAFASQNAAGTWMLTVYPGIAASANVSVNDAMPRVYRLKYVVTGTSVTCSTAYVHIL